MRLLCLCVFLLTIFSGCSESEETNKGDASILTDASLNDSIPKEGAFDQTGALDNTSDALSSGDKSCADIRTCVETDTKQCTSTDLSEQYLCIKEKKDNCLSKGCESGQKDFTTFWECLKEKCVMECIGGLDAKCLTCVTGKCGPEEQTCKESNCDLPQG